MVTETSPAEHDSADAPAHRVNPLIAAAEPLLLVINLLSQPQHPASLAELQRRLLDGLDDFAADAERHGIAEAQTDHARYALCALIDETILCSPWGARDWAEFSLLKACYDENYAGEAFFDRLNQAGALREHGVALLEFFHLCLSLGYSGRFHSRRQTAEGIERLREQVATLIRQFREPPPLLSTPLSVSNPTSVRCLPIWVSAALAGALLLGAYHGLEWYLTAGAEAVLTDLQSISREQ